jgi:hypothetical protein
MSLMLPALCSGMKSLGHFSWVSISTVISLGYTMLVQSAGRTDVS